MPSSLAQTIAYGLGVEDGAKDRERGVPRKTIAQLDILYNQDYINGYYDGYGN